MSTTNGGVRYLCKSILESSIFTNGIMFLVLLNAVSLSLEADVFIRKPYNDIFMIVNEIFYGLFLTEFLLKIYVLRLKYWKSFYNIVDFCILCGFAVQNMINILYPIQFGTVAQISAFIRILKTLRTLRLITLIKELQVLMDALLDSLAKFVIYVIIFIFLVIFLFALLGYYLFGHMVNKEGYWKNLWEALLSILTYLTAEGWTDIQSELDATSPGLGRFFSVTALVVGNFVLMNIFTGIIVMNISEALSSFKDLKHANFHESLADFYQSLSHDDYLTMTDTSTSLMWMETLIKTLTHQENTIWRISQLLNETMNSLIDECERKLEIEQSFNPPKTAEN
ncbi:unnamed protein product [Gordionus sp. m RMFG-2023]